MADSIKTLAGWHESKLDLTRYLTIGDEIDEELADYFLGVLPPAYYTSQIIQIGEPYDFVRGRETFITIARNKAGNWAYCGTCWRGDFMATV